VIQNKIGFWLIHTFHARLLKLPASTPQLIKSPTGIISKHLFKSKRLFTMKLGSILALVSSSFAIKATDADTSFLRKVTKVANGSGLAGRDKVNYGDESGFAGVAIFMDGVTGHDGSSDDIVSNCLVNAFNTVHKKANDDYELSDAFVAKSFVVPSPNSTLTDENDVLVASNPGDGDIRATQTKKKKNQAVLTGGSRLAITVVFAIRTIFYLRRLFSRTLWPRTMATCTRPSKKSFAASSSRRAVKCLPALAVARFPSSVRLSLQLTLSHRRPPRHLTPRKKMAWLVSPTSIVAANTRRTS
jgi:hypothetical protein